MKQSDLKYIKDSFAYISETDTEININGYTIYFDLAVNVEPGPTLSHMDNGHIISETSQYVEIELNNLQIWNTEKEAYESLTFEQEKQLINFIKSKVLL